LNRRLRKARTSGAGVKEVVCPETGTVKRLGGKGVSGRQDITSSTFKGKGGIWPRREKLVKVAGSEVVRVAERGAAVTIARAPRWREMSALERVMERRKRDEAMGNWFLERTEAAGEDLMVGWRNEGREENMIMDWRWFEDRISGNPKVTGLEWWNKDGSWSKGMWAPVAGGKLYVQGATELSEKQLLLNFETLFGRRGVEERRTAPGRSPAAWEM
jgi:hypothetical protein